MTAYRVGQRVRVTWPNGTAVEGTLAPKFDAGLAVLVPAQNGTEWPVWIGDSNGADLIAEDYAEVTILSEPRPEEPTGLGAVVEASIGRLVRTESCRVGDDRVWVDSNADAYLWIELVDPVVLHEGWTP